MIIMNFLDSLQYSLLNPDVSDPKKKINSSPANHLYYNASLPATQLLPFTCSSNSFCNIALNGLPDVDLGIYNEDLLNHKMSCDRKLYKTSDVDDGSYLIQNLDPAM